MNDMTDMNDLNYLYMSIMLSDLVAYAEARLPRIVVTAPASRRPVARCHHLHQHAARHDGLQILALRR